MNLLPKASGTRPRLACEIAPHAVIAGRSESPARPVAGVGITPLAEGAVLPGLKPGNLVDRLAVIAGLRRSLEEAGARPNGRGADVTLVIPDGAARVLLIDFDALPNKLSEALPLVRFRLKKLLPFDAEEAMVSFQVMSSGKSGVRVLAVAIPRDVLAEYESAAREAGFEPGAVLPSTLAVLAGADATAPASLIVNASRMAVTTAIAREGILLLHRTMDLQGEAAGVPAEAPAALYEPAADPLASHPLAEREAAREEWARPGNGHVPDMYAQAEPAPPSTSPYVGPTVTADLNAEVHQAILNAPTWPGTLTEPNAAETANTTVQPPLAIEGFAPGRRGAPLAEEMAEALSVAGAYFEDTLGTPPQTIWSAGSISAEQMEQMLREQGLTDRDGLRVRELVSPEALLAGAATVRVGRGMLAGIVGALRG